jgi:hypothetical protein
MPDTAIESTTTSTLRTEPARSADPAPSSSTVVAIMDRAVARVLRIRPQPAVPPEAIIITTTSSRAFETPLLISAARCTLRYVVLPFVLPLVAVAASATPGIVTGAALGILLTLDVIAAVATVAALRRLWLLQHPRRWQYLPVVLTLALLAGIFFTVDARVLLI